MRGRKPKPTVLKLIAGNPGHRPLNENEPKVVIVDGLPEPPKWLKTKGARDEWGIQIKYLSENKILGENELAMLADYCFLHGEFVKDARDRRVMHASLIGQMRALRAELGIGPSARSRIKAGSGKKEGKLSKYIKGA